MTTLYLLALAFALLASALDAVFTSRGIRAGLFVEGSSWVVALWHTNKPTLRQLLIFNTLELSPLVAAGAIRLILPSYNASVFCALAIGGLFAAGAKFSLGAYKAR